MATLFKMVPPEKEDLSNKKKYENLSIYSKIIIEQTLKYIYIQMNCIIFLPFEIGYKNKTFCARLLSPPSQKCQENFSLVK